MIVQGVVHLAESAAEEDTKKALSNRTIWTKACALFTKLSEHLVDSATATLEDTQTLYNDFLKLLQVRPVPPQVQTISQICDSRTSLSRFPRSISRSGATSRMSSDPTSLGHWHSHRNVANWSNTSAKRTRSQPTCQRYPSQYHFYIHNING